MTKREYYEQWAGLVFGWTWDRTRKTLAGITIFFVLAPLVLPYIRPYFHEWTGNVSEFLIPTQQLALLVLILFGLGRFFLAPYWIHQKLEKKVIGHETLREKCEKLAEYIVRGETISTLCRRDTPISTAEVKQWLADVRAYLEETFGPSQVVQWEHEDPSVTPPPFPSSPPGENNRTFITLFYRLRNLRELHNTLAAERIKKTHSLD